MNERDGFALLPRLITKYSNPVVKCDEDNILLKKIGWAVIIPSPNLESTSVNKYQDWVSRPSSLLSCPPFGRGGHWRRMNLR